MPPAIIGGVIAGVGAIGGAALGASATKKASAQATAAATDASIRNEALQRNIYNQNKGVLSPFVNSGMAAGQNINALLGIQPTVTGPSGGQQPGQPNALTGALAGYYDPMQTLGADQNIVTGALGPAPSSSPYQQAFDAYRNSTGYSFRLGEGQKSLNASFAARGLGNSGAAAKAALGYGQNIASDEFGKYLGYLGQQQQVGLSAGNALAGVGTNFANATTANNSALAGVSANAALANGSATAQMYGTAAGAIGKIGGGFLSSYGGGLDSWGGQRNPYGIAGDPVY